MIKTLKELVRLSNTLDSRGLVKEADELDGIIKKIAKLTPVGIAYYINQMFKNSRHDNDKDREELVKSLKATAATEGDGSVISFVINTSDHYYAFSRAHFDGPTGNSLVMNIEDLVQNSDLGDWQYEAGTDLLQIGRNSAFPLKVSFWYNKSLLMEQEND